MKLVPKIVYVAMSGGVDSSVAAVILKKRGFKVVGVYMKQWAPEFFERDCPWKREREDAMRVATKMGIPLLTWDFSKEYEREVGKYMIKTYRAGITPNPDVMCNKIIKFGLFFERAMKEGADYIATGHYAKIQNSNFKLAKLVKAKDQNKDQTYFLWMLKQKVLAKTLFPIGNYTKPEVRKIAKKFGLHIAEKKDSQGICFIGPLDIKVFLKGYIKPKKGRILALDGKVLGIHDGVYYYTIGQRHGLDIKLGGGPYYVVKKDIKKNLIYVGQDKDLFSSRTRVTNTSWLNRPTKFPILLNVKIRYRTPSAKAILSASGDLKFKKPQRAITPGQSAVFYHNQELLGGGIIK